MGEKFRLFSFERLQIVRTNSAPFPAEDTGEGRHQRFFFQWDECEECVLRASKRSKGEGEEGKGKEKGKLERSFV